MDIKAAKKIARKLKHCEGILLKNENIRISDIPTDSIFIGNGGLGCGIGRELLVDLFSLHGFMKDVVMLPEKPYAFVTFCTVEEAEKTMNYFQGRRLKTGHVFYMSYINSESVPKRIFSSKSWPEGLTLLEDFVADEEEKEMLSLIQFDNENESAILKHRKVKHFGYEFIYGSNNINKDECLKEKIPSVFIPYLEKLLALGYISKIPDQLTVNHYAPGQGIPSHIDTHSAFEDGIISLSLGSQVIMDFYHPGKESIPILLPRRSLIIMSGESRYAWKHGITPRKTDVVSISSNKEGHLTLSHRSTRISFTFRKIRDGECNCKFIDECDSQLLSKLPTTDLVSEEEAKELESKFVNKVYEEIADHFSDTRYKPWPKVHSFLNSVPPGSLILDIGCGNGKNLGLSNGCFEIGCDASSKLAQVCAIRKAEVLVADCLRLPFRENCADTIICIAVIHHLSTKVRRAKAIQEIVRVLCPGGKALIYVWAFEQDGPDGPSNYLKHSKLEKDYQKDPKLDENNSMLQSAEIHLGSKSSKLIKMPVHKNRTNFVEQDMLVPWKEKKSLCEELSNDKEIVHHRYYHVFAEGELESLILQNKGKIISSYYDKGNWCVLFET